VTQNPFEAPRFESEFQPHAAARIDVGRAIGDAWRATIGDLVTVIIGGVIFFSTGLACLVTVLGFLLFFPVIVYGGFKMLLNLHDGIAGYTDLSEGFSRYWTSLGDALVLMLAQTLLYLPWIASATAAAMMENQPLGIATQLAGLAVVVVLVPRFVFAPFYMVDRPVSAIEGMKLSWDATAEQKLPVFLLFLASGAIATVGSACGITALIAVPMSFVMFASAFRQMHPRQKASLAPAIRR
jgi:hypothetical protein